MHEVVCYFFKQRFPYSVTKIVSLHPLAKTVAVAVVQ